jgi:hypothetical protein
VSTVRATPAAAAQRMLRLGRKEAAGLERVTRAIARLPPAAR